jgi:spermidine synthase
VFSDRITKYAEGDAYAHHIVFAKSTPYQRIILTENEDDFRLYLNGNLQFSSKDEYRYHEALVHPAVQSAVKPRRALVLGGGDGMAIRELIKYPELEEIFIVELDPEMTELFTRNETLSALNSGSLLNSKVKIINTDAFIWLKENQEIFDVIIVDFPDPSNYSLGKLYSMSFYEELKDHLSAGGTCSVQSTSPLFARKSYWCVENTCRAAGFATLPYHAYVPSFGEWGFILLSHDPQSLSFIDKMESFRFIDTSTWQQMMLFPQDMSELETDVNRLNNQVLVQYFEEEWSHYE